MKTKRINASKEWIAPSGISNDGTSLEKYKLIIDETVMYVFVNEAMRVCVCVCVCVCVNFYIVCAWTTAAWTNKIAANCMHLHWTWIRFIVDLCILMNSSIYATNWLTRCNRHRLINN